MTENLIIVCRDSPSFWKMFMASAEGFCCAQKLTLANLLIFYAAQVSLAICTGSKKKNATHMVSFSLHRYV